MRRLTVTTAKEAMLVGEDAARRLGHWRLSSFTPITYGHMASCRECGHLVLLEHIQGVWMLSGGAAVRPCEPRREEQ